MNQPPAAVTTGTHVAFQKRCRYHGDLGTVLRVSPDSVNVHTLNGQMVTVSLADVVVLPADSFVELQRKRLEVQLIERVGVLSLQLVDVHQQLSQLRHISQQPALHLHNGEARTSHHFNEEDN